MRHALTILAHRRPYYLGQTLDALSRCEGIEDWRIVVVMDRPSHATESLVDSWQPVRREVVSIDLGNASDPAYFRISRATLIALSLGFATSEYVVHLEEDCVPEPDFLAWHLDMAEAYRDRTSVFTVNAWSKDLSPGVPELNYLTPWFTPWGWGTWLDRFEEMRAAWDLQYWDRHLNERLRGSRFGVFPSVPRVRNIGRIGTQSEAEWVARERP